MFRNKSLNVKVVRDPRPVADSPDDRSVFIGVEVAAGYAEIIKEVVTHTALIVGGVWCLCKIAERLCK